MKILQVIHGYPMRYNAGSEVYTQTLCHALAERHEAHVFTREEDPFAPDFRLRVEPDPEDPRITLHVVNNPRNRDRYREPGVDRRFAELLDRLHAGPRARRTPEPSLHLVAVRGRNEGHPGRPHPA